jgi:hypothetical protein
MGAIRKRPPGLVGHKPWEQQPQEPIQQYASFRHYLSLGPQRSLAQAQEGTGLSLARLKQLSTRWRWLYRALAWDREQFLRRRREELARGTQTRERLLKESADWQKVAGMEFRRWVTRDADGNPQLVRELTPAEAIRLWQVGAEALEELQGPAVAAYQQSLPAKPGYQGETPVQRRFREAIEAAAYQLCYRATREVGEALRRVLMAWGECYWKHHRDPDFLDFEHSVWPWDLPYEEA